MSDGESGREWEEEKKKKKKVMKWGGAKQAENAKGKASENDRGEYAEKQKQKLRRASDESDDDGADGEGEGDADADTNDDGNHPKSAKKYSKPFSQFNVAQIIFKEEVAKYDVKKGARCFKSQEFW
jgi:hypothetical protein